MLKVYYSLTKPGIIYGNLITVAAGFLLASKGSPSYLLLFETLFGISLVIASGCVFNNIIDRDIDSMMDRTKGRALVKGLVPVKHAYIFAIILAIIGGWTLEYHTNFVAFGAAIFGLLAYVFIYSLWSKRHSIYGTLLGSISGAIPPVVGYSAVSSQIDTGAIILFLILTVWQMPHSYAIAIYRLTDYKNANIPVLPVKNGILYTKKHMLGYTLLFTAGCLSLFKYGYTGTTYLLGTFVLGLMWIFLSLAGFMVKNEVRWAKYVFIFSIIVLCIFSILISIDAK